MEYVVLCQNDLPYFLLLLRSLSSRKESARFVVDNEEMYKRLCRMGIPARITSFTKDKEKLVKDLNLQEDSCLIVSIKNRNLLDAILKVVEQHYVHQPTLVIEEQDIPLPEKLSAVPFKPSSIFTDLCKPLIDRAFTKRKVHRLRDLFANKDKILLLIQSDPDPDAIASALALRHLLGRNRSTAHIGSFGEVTRPENLAMLRLLDITVEKITPEMVEKYDAICLLDVQPPHLGEAGNQCILSVDAVIDHHPEKPGYHARIKDIRASYGATSTILTEYLRSVDFNISQRLATALLYGIKSDTFFLGRGVAPADIDAFSYLYPLANANILRRIERPEVHPDDIDSFSRALKNRKIINGILFSHLGKVKREDVIPHFADFSLQIEGVEWSVVSGIFNQNLIISVRNVGYVRSAGVLVKKAFGHLGSAGGHSYMAKAVIPLKTFYDRFGIKNQAALRDRIMELFLSGFEEIIKDKDQEVRK